MPATRREPFTIPARCPWCDAQAGVPQNSGTAILANAVHVALECDACGQNWHVDIPITRRAAVATLRRPGYTQSRADAR